MRSVATALLAGTVAIEPNRWAGPTSAPIAVSPWLDRLADAGFDGIELWERHLVAATPAEAAAVLEHQLPVAVLNSYVSLDDPDDGARRTVADSVRRAGAEAVKFNVGNDPGAVDDYADRIARWLEMLPHEVSLLCECHHGISIAEDPPTAAAIFAAAAPADRLGAIVHTHEHPDHLRARFDAYGERIRHVHVNHLDVATLTAPRLSEAVDRLAAQVDLLDELGFVGTWTIEFVEGVGTDHDHVAHLVDQACHDLAVLRDVVGAPG